MGKMQDSKIPVEEATDKDNQKECRGKHDEEAAEKEEATDKESGV